MVDFNNLTKSMMGVALVSENYKLVKKKKKKAGDFVSTGTTNIVASELMKGW